ncbi:DHHW family protein [Acetitomaculum ruminis]|nr:DHHW family protein [Acetitomaculum ruminis]
MNYKKVKLIIMGVMIGLSLTSCQKDNGSNSSSKSASDIVSDTKQDLSDDSSSLSQNEEDKIDPKLLEDREVDVSTLSIQNYGSFLVVNDTAYEYYSYNDEITGNFAANINRAVALAPNSKVYSIIVPTNYEISLYKNVKEMYPSYNQKEAIESIYSRQNAGSINIDIVDTLKAHRDEYIYYRTDHHWTSLGAFYAYQKFAKEKGIKYNSLDSFEEVQFPGFLGSFYTESKSSALSANSDVVYAYKPNSTNELEFYDENGNVTNWNIIEDVSNWNAGSKYNTFISGDNPLVKITNPTLSDNSSIVVIKESYGNALVPFLVDHYQHVYVIDYRYYKNSFSSFLSEYPVDDVLFVNYLSASLSSSNVSRMQNFLR